MADSLLLPQPAYNPQYAARREGIETVIEMGLSRTDVLIAFDELINTIKENKREKPVKRLGMRIVDYILWKLFQCAVFVMLLASGLLFSYLMYSYMYKEQIDSIFTHISGFASELSTFMARTVRTIESIHRIISAMDGEAARVARVAYDELQADDESVDALFLAIN